MAARKKAETPKPDGSIVLTFRTGYTPEQRDAMEEDVQNITKRIADDRATLAKVKAQLRRKSSSERVRCKVDLQTMVVMNTATGEQVHPARLSGLQWKLAIDAAKAAE